MVCVTTLKVIWRASFAGLSGAIPHREAQTDLTDIVDLGDQMWHKIAGVREQKARDFNLHDYYEEVPRPSCHHN